MMRATPITIHQSPAKQQGVVLVTALVFLVILTLLGISSMSTNTLEERMAANVQDINRAFQAAESGVNVALTDGTSFSGTTRGYTYTGTDVPVGSYGGNINYVTSYLDSSEIQFQDISVAGSAGVFKHHHYDVKSTGSTATGASTSVGVGIKVLGT